MGWGTLLWVPVCILGIVGPPGAGESPQSICLAICLMPRGAARGPTEGGSALSKAWFPGKGEGMHKGFGDPTESKWLGNLQCPHVICLSSCCSSVTQLGLGNDSMLPAEQWGGRSRREQ